MSPHEKQWGTSNFDLPTVSCMDISLQSKMLACVEDKTETGGYKELNLAHSTVRQSLFCWPTSGFVHGNTNADFLCIIFLVLRFLESIFPVLSLHGNVCDWHSSC